MERGKAFEDIVINFPHNSRHYLHRWKQLFTTTMTAHTPWKLFTASALLKHQLRQYMKSIALGSPSGLSLPDWGFRKDRATSYPHVCTWSPAECLENSIFSVNVYWLVDYYNEWSKGTWCFQIVVLEKTVESPLNNKKIKPVNVKGNQPWIFIGRTDA